LRVVGDPDFDTRNRAADGADLPVVEFIERDDGGGLGQAVAFEDVDAGLAQIDRHMLWQGRAA
jgi:hypothetical protein